MSSFYIYYQSISFQDSGIFVSLQDHNPIKQQLAEILNRLRSKATLSWADTTQIFNDLDLIRDALSPDLFMAITSLRPTVYSPEMLTLVEKSTNISRSLAYHEGKRITLEANKEQLLQELDQTNAELEKIKTNSTLCSSLREENDQEATQLQLHEDPQTRRRAIKSIKQYLGTM